GPCLLALCFCLHRSRPSRVSYRVPRHTTYPRRESALTTLNRRSQKGYVENLPQSHRIHSRHFHETGRHHQPATRSRAATHFPASPVVLLSRFRPPASLYPLGTAPLRLPKPA